MSYSSATFLREGIELINRYLSLMNDAIIYGPYGILTSLLTRFVQCVVPLLYSLDVFIPILNPRRTAYTPFSLFSPFYDAIEHYRIALAHFLLERVHKRI